MGAVGQPWRSELHGRDGDGQRDQVSKSRRRCRVRPAARRSALDPGTSLGRAGRGDELDVRGAGARDGCFSLAGALGV